ncbi:holo-[acyl-carrier protein] synthase [Geosmithia morbida]|uniref:Holo-[acyl-carrier protein] synthase n=1 Tax=Geosmithia morbida TaxID=1094350 RepID=A0A9P5D8J6_9HYPO|nr:holo-[acyl-carrier protein] synthase [Geosmithia morbida]KAF4126860.1 holo-[acyl-carrier protein] synthase [Geosmithia morbida]
MRPLRPFPFPFNVGTDICQISRIHRILRSPRRARFARRVLAPEEQRAGIGLRLVSSSGTDSGDGSSPCHGSNPSVKDGDELWKSAVFVAGRFAAKEAAIKAHSHRRLTFQDIIIERRRDDQGQRLGSGPPIARIRGEEGAEEDTSAAVSISHDGDYATAVCIGYDPRDGVGSKT